MTLTGKQYFISLVAVAVVVALVTGYLFYSINQRKIAQAERTVIGLQIENGHLIEQKKKLANDTLETSRYIVSLEELVQHLYSDTGKIKTDHENNLIRIRSLSADGQLRLFTKNFSRFDTLYYHR